MEKRLLNVSVNSKGSLLHALSRTVDSTWLKDKKSEIRRLQTLCLRLSVSCLSRARRSRHVFFTLLLATMATDLRSVLLPPVPPDATPARILPVGSFAPFEDAE